MLAIVFDVVVFVVVATAATIHVADVAIDVVVSLLYVAVGAFDVVVASI